MSKITPIVWTEEVKVEEEDDSKEDGELSCDSEVDELVDVDYNILPRPPTLASESDGMANKIKNEGANAMECDDVAPIKLEYSDDEDSLKNDSSSDSDSDEPTSKKKFERYNRLGSSFSKPTTSNFVNPNAFPISPYGNNMTMPSQAAIQTVFASCNEANPLPEGITDADISTVEQKMLSYQEKRRSKNFNIWSQVLQEEAQKTVMDKFGNVDVDSSKIVVERGPETYVFNGMTSSRKRKHNVPAGHKKKKTDKSKDYADDSDVSSAGLSDDDLDYIRSSKEPSTSVPSPFILDLEKEDAGESSTYDAKEMKEHMGKLRGRQLCYFMAQQLQEHKYQLIVRACELLGKKYCSHMFLKSMKIEQKGGLLIKSKTRRRTPGGIFFYMIRNDDKYPKEKIDLIFEVDKIIVMRDKKKRVNAKLREGKEQLGKFQQRQEKYI